MQSTGGQSKSSYQPADTALRHEPLTGISWSPGCNSASAPAGGTLLWRRGDGARYAVLSSHDGSVVWMLSRLPSSIFVVDISFDVRNLDGPDCCVPVIYAGRAEPCYPAFFTSDYEPIQGGWHRRQFSLMVPHYQLYRSASGAEVVIAIGFADPGQDRAEVTPGQKIAIANLLVSPR